MRDALLAVVITLCCLFLIVMGACWVVLIKAAWELS